MFDFLKKRKNEGTAPVVSRRGFLKVAAVGIGGATLLAAVSAPAFLTGNSRKISGTANLNRSDFSPRLGEVFAVRKGPLVTPCMRAFGVT